MLEGRKRTQMKMMHTGDLHIGKTVNEFSMLEDQKFILKQMLDIMEKESVQVLLIAGDIYDRSVPSAEAVEVFDWFLTETSKLNISICLVSGNHDSGERISFGKDILKQHNIYIRGNLDGIGEPIVLTDAYGTVNVWLLPFFRPAQLKAFGEQLELRDYESAIHCMMEQMKVNKEERNILVTHHFVINRGKEPVEETDSEQRISIGGIEQVDYHAFDSFDYVALGHLHGAQKVGRETVRYSGSPLKYSFSEEFHQKSVVVLDVKEKGTITYDLIPLKPMKDMRRVEGRLEELLKEEIVNAENRQDYIGVTLTDEEEIFDAITKVRAVYPNVMQLSFKRKEQKREDLVQTLESIKQKTPFDLTKDFLQRVNGEEQLDQFESMVSKWMQELMEQKEG